MSTRTKSGSEEYRYFIPRTAVAANDAPSARGPVESNEVYQRELEDLLVRREKAGLAKPGNTAEGLRDQLVGLSFSGGGLRSSCFSLGLTQALLETGFWRYVDYLSTVSGGGYLGGYLASLCMKRRQALTKGSSPLVCTDDHCQPPDVQKFIYGGRYLMRPLEFTNKYLVGLFFLNLTVFSLLIFLSCGIAFIWRCFDYPAFRNRAELVDLSSDLIAPFFPFSAFLLGWLMAWVVSYWRRGAEASGSAAKALLVLTGLALLVALALLLGNGDISTNFLRADHKEGLKPYQGIGASIVGLVLGALVPLLNPRRLIESGIRPKHTWERWVFSIVSFAMLIGVPMVLIGVFSQENISGYNDHAHRPVVEEDIQDWAAFCGFLLHDGVSNKPLQTNRSVTPSAPPPATTGATATQEVVAEPATVRQHLRSILLGGAGNTADLRPITETQARVESWVHFLMHESSSAKHSTLSPSERKFVAGLLTGAEEDSMPDVVRWRFLLLEQLLKIKAQAALEWRALDTWNDRPILSRGGKITTALAWMLGMQMVDQDDDIHRLWRAARLAEQVEAQICRPDGKLNQMLKEDETLTQLLWADRPSESRAPEADRQRLQSLAERVQLAGLSGFLPYERAELNRLLLEERFPSLWRSRQEIRRRVSIEKDQQTRLRYAGYALVVLLITGFSLDLNATSMHRYYRNCLAQVFLVPSHEKSPNVLLSELRTTDFGAPYHLFSCSVSGAAPLHVKRMNLLGLQHPAVKAEELRSDTFLFSRQYCGAEVTGFVPTIEYENWIRGERNELTLSEVVALSGAAVSPVNVRTPLVAALMFLMNLRLGQWIPNPAHGPTASRPSPFSVLAPYVLNFFRRSKQRPYCFVTDGGVLENLGLLQLLKRRCKLIIVVDASGDAGYHFHDLARAVRLARIHEGVVFQDVEGHQLDDGKGEGLDVRPLIPRTVPGDTEKHSPTHWLVARIIYPKQEPGWLVYVKPTLTGDEGVDLYQYRAVEPLFPQESTQDQMYNRDQVESYRRLGYHIGQDLCQALQALNGTRDFWEGAEPLRPEDVGEELANVYLARKQAKPAAKRGRRNEKRESEETEDTKRA